MMQYSRNVNFGMCLQCSFRSILAVLSEDITQRRCHGSYSGVLFIVRLLIWSYTVNQSLNNHFSWCSSYRWLIVWKTTCDICIQCVFRSACSSLHPGSESYTVCYSVKKVFIDLSSDKCSSQVRLHRCECWSGATASAYVQRPFIRASCHIGSCRFCLRAVQSYHVLFHVCCDSHSLLHPFSEA